MKKMIKCEKRRVMYLKYMIIFLFLILLVRLFDVMIIKNNEFRKKIDEINYNVVYGESTPRGRILDRNGKVIVDNKAVNTIIYKRPRGVTYKEMIDVAGSLVSHLELDYYRMTNRAIREYYLYNSQDELDELISKDEYKLYEMRKLTNLDLEELKIKRISEEVLSLLSDEERKTAYLFYLMRSGYSYSEVIIKSNVSDYEFAYVSENNGNLVGFDTKVDWVRSYPYGDTMKSILGTVSSSTQGVPKELKDYYVKLGYSLNDRVGLSYLEKEYERYLKGVKSRYEIINSRDMVLVREGKCGNDIYLSIDIELQVATEEIIKQEVLRAKKEANTEYFDHSSVIIQDPNTGEVLVMASKRLVGEEFVDNAVSLMMLPITPGSVVKGASILVGYNTGALKIGEVMYDECVQIAGLKKKCSSVDDLGSINDIEALAKSSNVYQFKTAIRVNGQEYRSGMKLKFNQKSFDTYRKMYRSFGLGVKTGIDLDGEGTGYTSIDKNAGNLLDYVMGQYESYTPLQLSQYINTIANGGSRYKVHLLREVRDLNNQVIYEYKPYVLNRINTDGSYMKRMREGFYAVMHMRGGYGRGYIDEGYDASGKTGTSQSFIDTNNDGIIDTETITSSFVGYVPSNNPKYSIVVTSPNSSRENSNNQFMSMVTKRITREVTRKCGELYEL